MMKFTALILALSTPLVRSDLVLSKEIMDLALTSAKLSKLAYVEKPSTSDTADYSDFGNFIEEPDQALIAKTKDGYCFVSFRGTSMTWDDWKQNLDMGTEEICVNIETGVEKCCTSRRGFYQAYNTGYRDELEKAVRDCAKTCDNKDECVVITGHSQGGAVAEVAALYLADLNPYIFTFGQPLTLDAPCDLITSDRIYRFVNTKETESMGIAYDPITMAPGLTADYFGNMIVLGPDSTGVAFMGLDAQDYLTPYAIGVEAHYMAKGSSLYAGYEDRIKALMETETYPIRNNGYIAGSLCSEDKECESKKCGAETLFTFNRCIGTTCEKDEECDTDRCDTGLCIPKLGSCMVCDEDSDCAGQDGKCLFFKCTNKQGLMDNNCFCRFGSDCDSGRCEGVTNPQCEAPLALGGSCNEDSDCLSDNCAWSFRCEMKKGGWWGSAGPGNPSSNGAPWSNFSIIVGLVGAAGFILFVKQRRAGYLEVPSGSMEV